jgi:hypothetical protein
MRRDHVPQPMRQAGAMVVRTTLVVFVRVTLVVVVVVTLVVVVVGVVSHLRFLALGAHDVKPDNSCLCTHATTL